MANKPTDNASGQPVEGQPLDTTNVPTPPIVDEVQKAGQPQLLDQFGQPIPYLIGEPEPWVVNPDYVRAFNERTAAEAAEASGASQEHDGAEYVRDEDGK